jgi:tRNA threonylcarbamoyladenosine biosynthesis protein TsaB
MRILAIETTAFTGSVALLEADRVRAERKLPDDSRSAQSLLPTIAALLRDESCTVEELDLVAVAAGPGSFTGLRVGITTAKTLAYARQIEVLGIDTLDVLALQAWGHHRGERVHAVLDAQRNQLFAAQFAGAGNDAFPTRLNETHIVDLDPWLASLRPGEWVVGPTVGKWCHRLPSGVGAADPECWHPQAGVVGRLAWRDYQLGRRDNLWRLAPQYHRASAAEEKAAGKIA